jgi:DNA-binding NarL/FixJ family response regulator
MPGQSELRFPPTRARRHSILWTVGAGIALFVDLGRRKWAMASKILIVDDHEAVRRGLRHMLEESPEWQVVGEAADGREAVEKTSQLSPDLIVMDFLMPNMNGLEAAREITKLPHHPPILMLTMYMSRQLVEEARRAGIRGALHKSETGKVVTGLQALLRRETFFLPAK